MRQRTLGLIAGACLLAGAAVGVGSAVYAYQATSPSPPPPRAAHHAPFARPHPGFGHRPDAGFMR